MGIFGKSSGKGKAAVGIAAAIFSRPSSDKIINEYGRGRDGERVAKSQRARESRNETTSSRSK